MAEKDTSYSGPKVLGTGLPRTGTASLETALEILGFAPCHHFKSFMNETFPYRTSRLWQQALMTDDRETRQKMLHTLYSEGRYKAGADYPTALFTEDLVEMYPEAKFIHGVRSSPEQWRRSFNTTLGSARAPFMYYSCFLLPFYHLALMSFLNCFKAREEKNQGCNSQEPSDSVEIYHRHNERVRCIVPKDRLLEFQPTDGWEPLCKFLGVDIPTDKQGVPLDYPRTNDTRGFWSRMWLFIIMGWFMWAFLIGALYSTAKYFSLLGWQSFIRDSQFRKRSPLSSPTCYLLPLARLVRYRAERPDDTNMFSVSLE